MRQATLIHLALSSALVSLLLGATIAAAARMPSVAAHPYSAGRAGAIAHAPVADLRAFRGQGRLAFLWGGQLFLLDGSKGVLRQITSQGQTTDPTWSPDGHRLAYLRDGVLWLTGADGSGAHRAAALPSVAASYTWSPRGDMLAVSLADSGGAAGALWLVSSRGQSRRLGVAAADPLWSPDGSRLAYSLTLPYRDPQTRSDALYTMSANGGHPTRIFVAQQSGIRLERWWPNGKGLTFRIDEQHSASLAADGLPLYTMPLAGNPRLLTTSLGYPTWLAWSPSGRQMLLVAGGGRETWHGKSLAICDVYAARYRALPQPSGVVSLDPTWSPSGREIAFVRARDLGDPGGFDSTPMLSAWVRTRTLWLASATGAGARQLTAAGSGIYEPQWSADGRHLLYIHANSLWLIDTRGGPARRILGPFPTTPDLYPLGYYGHLTWSGLLALNRS